MSLGTRFRQLWRMRPVVAASVVLALVVATWSVARISILPPRIESRSLEMATAATHVVVDKPRSTILDLREDTYSLEALRQRAIVLGNVVANGEVRDAIARHAHVPSDKLQIAPPLTPNQPRPVVASTDRKHATDLLASTDQYRLSIQANPTVPTLDFYAQAPNPASAALLANTAVDQLRAYLKRLAVSEQTPEAHQVRLLQLGRAEGAVINASIDVQVAVLVFLITFGIACATLIFASRVRDGWRAEALRERAAEN
jgi:hypothetical protein